MQIPNKSLCHQTCSTIISSVGKIQSATGVPVMFLSPPWDDDESIEIRCAVDGAVRRKPTEQVLSVCRKNYERLEIGESRVDHSSTSV